MGKQEVMREEEEEGMERQETGRGGGVSNEEVGDGEVERKMGGRGRKKSKASREGRRWENMKKSGMERRGGKILILSGEQS